MVARKEETVGRSVGKKGEWKGRRNEGGENGKVRRKDETRIGREEEKRRKEKGSENEREHGWNGFLKR